MKYYYPCKVADVNAYDLPLLVKELNTAGLPALEIHIGASVLLIEMSRAITAQEKDTLSSAVAIHSPTWFTWTENGQTVREKVRCAEDVDRLTAQRIRGIVSGYDSIQEQLKQLRLTCWALNARVKVLEGQAISAADTTMANAITVQMIAVNASIESVRQEGKTFKILHNWS